MNSAVPASSHPATRAALAPPVPMQESARSPWAELVQSGGIGNRGGAGPCHHPTAAGELPCHPQTFSFLPHTTTTSSSEPIPWVLIIPGAVDPWNIPGLCRGDSSGAPTRCPALVAQPQTGPPLPVPPQHQGLTQLPPWHGWEPLGAPVTGEGTFTVPALHLAAPLSAPLLRAPGAHRPSPALAQAAERVQPAGSGGSLLYGTLWRGPAHWRQFPGGGGPVGAMDVGELLSYQRDSVTLSQTFGGHFGEAVPRRDRLPGTFRKPNRGTKRPRDEEEEEIKARRKQASSREHGRHREEEAAALEETDDEKKKLLQIIERDGEEEEEEEEPLDESSVKKMILTFEKRSYKNQELRIKFPDNPEKFMESELDLNDIIQEMHVIATMPDLYHLLVELNAVQSLLGLLGHDNTDVSIAVVDLLQELTDIDTLHESEEGAEVLIDALVEGQVVALLVQNLERLDESVKEEADGVHNTLAIVENMAEFRPEMCTEAAQQGLMQWLLKRLKAKMPFDANKLYCSEVLAILLQNNDDNRELLGELDGIDVLLQQLSVFKRHNPSTAEEQEMMENLFDSLCSCLMLSSNRDRFLKGEGLQLMNLMLREKKISRSSALKVLDHAMIGPEGTDNCHKFVDILGLRTIFPLFMKSPKKIKKVGTTEKEHEEHVCSILASLLRNLRGQQRTRLLNKFTENDSEKVDRLMELYFKYLDAMQAADKKIDGEKHDMVRRGEIIDDDMEDEFYLRRLDAGLFVLQLICYIMAEICNANVPQVRQRVHQILNMRGSSIKIVRHILKEYAENIGDGKNQEFRESEQKRILDLLENF
ncbi:beta-catenin-like protein 1 [Indicator indicator]|uniref:beta-catenin-like protein 1 n=1 Tax=Indicator indicator TaxID=1002788 RepID=UPI0023E03DE1|nr:beta-catenin-like protein 1 [Indicator indicator]